MIFAYYVSPKGRPHCAEDMGKKGIEKGGENYEKTPPFLRFYIKKHFRQN